jgi:hypothetical protein
VSSLTAPGSGPVRRADDLLYRALLPPEREIAFLRACLLAGDAAATSWQRWIEISGNPLEVLRNDRIGVKRHLPRLYANLTAAGADPGPDLGPYLRTAVAREKLRSHRFRGALGEALDALASAGIHPVLLRGTAIGETVVAAPWLRHSHDADLHVASGELQRARGALEAAGFQHRSTPRTSSTLRLDHANGLPVCLHAHLLDAAPATLDEPRILARAVAAPSLDRAVRVLRHEDALLHVCCHATTHGSRRALGWVIDAVTLIRADGFDWNRFDATAWASAGVLLAPALTVIDAVVPGIVPADVLRRARAVEPRAAEPARTRDLRALRLRAAAVSMSARELLWHANGAAEKVTIVVMLVRHLPPKLVWRIRSAWEEKWLKTVRRHRSLGPLRKAWLRVKPAVARGTSAGGADRPPTWRERDLS